MSAITLKNISKKYVLSRERPLLLKNLFIPSKKEEIWALKDISLEIKKGETIGIIGENGSGKSTLLKIISGITTPTSGKVEVNGRVASLIELGAGFQPDLTGKENVYLNGTLLGLTKKEIDKKYKEIVDFADIGEFIDQPVRTYSSGMTVRLGFSVAIHLDPDILLIDEVLAVGDEEFQQKCLTIINQFKELNKTLIFVSHDMNLIHDICPKAIWIKKGIIRMFKETQRVIRSYSIGIKTSKIIPFGFKKRWGTGKVKIVDSVILNKYGQPKTVFNEKDKVSIRVKVKFNENITNPVFGITVRNSDFHNFYAINTSGEKIKTGIIKKNNIKEIKFFLNGSFPDGKYYVSPAVSSSDFSEFFDWWNNCCSFIIKTRSNNLCKGKIAIS